MSNLAVLFIGGVVPAFLWGLTAVLQKLSAQQGVGPAYYLAIFGLVIAFSGVTAAYYWAQRFGQPPVAGTAYAALAGLTFAAGTGLIGFALWRYGAPISKLAPILSCNVVVTIAVARFLLDEGRIDAVKLGFGTGLILIGAALVVHA